MVSSLETIYSACLFDKWTEGAPVCYDILQSIFYEISKYYASVYLSNYFHTAHCNPQCTVNGVTL